MRNYNLFRRKERDELICAVPEDRPVPAFITDTFWEFGGKLENADQEPFAFNREAADASVRVNGFYLFQMTKRPDVRLPVHRRREGDAARQLSDAQNTSARAISPEANRWRGDDGRFVQI